MTALARTETLLRHTWPVRKEDVAAGPLAGLPEKIFAARGWALALARQRWLQLRGRFGTGRFGLGFARYLGFDGPQRLVPACGPLFALALPIAARLLPATLLARRAGAIAPATVPTTPLPGVLLAGFAAIALLGRSGAKELLTTLQEATAAASPAGEGQEGGGKREERTVRPREQRTPQDKPQSGGDALGSGRATGPLRTLLRITIRARASQGPKRTPWLRGSATAVKRGPGHHETAIHSWRPGPLRAAIVAYMVAAVNTDVPDRMDFLKPMEIKRLARVPYSTVIGWLTTGHPRAGILPSIDLAETGRRHSFRIRREDWEAFLAQLQTVPRERQRAKPLPRPTTTKNKNGMFHY